VEQLGAALIEDFLVHIERERRNGAVTRNVRLAAIKAFMRYVEYRIPSGWSKWAKSAQSPPNATSTSSFNT
jgi:hypothetical protein